MVLMLRASKIILLVLLAPLAIGQTKPATKPAPATIPSVITFAAASADLKARGAWLHTEVARQADAVAKKPISKVRSLAITTARYEEGKIDAVVAEAIAALDAVKADKTGYVWQLTRSRLYVNDRIDMILTILKDTDEPITAPAWLGLSVPVPAAATKALDTKLDEAISQAWATINPDGVTGMGVAGAGGRESVYSIKQGDIVGGFAEALSGRISYRINQNKGKPIINPTTPNFAFILTQETALGTTTYPEKTVLERRKSLWYSRPPLPDISAADAPATTPTTRAK